jgi:hypothetical protein
MATLIFIQGQETPKQILFLQLRRLIPPKRYSQDDLNRFGLLIDQH